MATPAPVPASYRASFASSRQQSYGVLPTLPVRPRERDSADRTSQSIFDRPSTVGRSTDIRTTFSATYQATIEKLYEERDRRLATTNEVPTPTASDADTDVKLDAEANDDAGMRDLGDQPDLSKSQTLDHAFAQRRISNVFRNEARLVARRRWRKIRSRIDEIRNERMAVKQATGWESIFKRVRDMVALERERRDLYERYGFVGLPNGQFPRSNPMSLFPAAQYPNGDEEGVPRNVTSLIKKTRQEVSRLYVENSRSKVGSATPGRAGSVAPSNRSSRITKYFTELRSRTMSQITSRATTAMDF